MDGAYLGHAYREARLSLRAGGSGAYRGEWYLLEETLRDLRSEARLLDRSGSLELSLGPLGALGGGLEAPLPALRGLPAPPPEALRPGLSWIGEGAYLLELQGERFAFPFLAEYRAMGPVDYGGRPAFLLRAKFALRARELRGSGGLLRVREASGSHELDIYLDGEGGLPLLIRDRFEESYAFSSGPSESRSGFRLLFYEGGAPGDRGALAAALGGAVRGAEPGLGAASGGAAQEAAGGAGPAGGVAGGGAGVGSGGAAQEAAGGRGSGGGADSGGSGARAGEALLGAGPGPLAGEGELPLAAGPEFREAGLELEAAEAGLLLRIPDLRFLPDSAELLPEEAARLDLVALALLAAEGRSFLVEGHSAEAGRPQGELALSLLRARRVVEELAARGLAPSRFVYRGLGSARPLADNGTESGRARNRRVEITILD